MPQQPAFDMGALQHQLEGAQKFAADAASGAVKVDEAAGQALLKALNDGFDRLNDLRTRARRVSDPTKLGSSPAAQVAIPANISMATGDDQSFDVVLTKLIEMTTKARDGVQQAMDNYRNTEHGNQRRIHRSGA